MRRCGGPTFRLRKLALFNAGLEGLVEHGVKLCLGRELNLVVGLDVFLDRLATIEGETSQLSVTNSNCDRR